MAVGRLAETHNKKNPENAKDIMKNSHRRKIPRVVMVVYSRLAGIYERETVGQFSIVVQVEVCHNICE
jgi:hypothetical protein